MSLERRIDELYALPLAEFTAARNDFAKSLRADGDKEAAARVKALAKPSLSAWAVNQLHHHQGDELDALLAAGEQLRAAQLGGAGERQQATAERRRILSRLLDRAEEHVRSAGGAAGRVLRQRVGRSLEALSAYPADDPARPPLGRLVADVEPRGFGALGALRASLERPPAASRKPEKTKAKATKGKKPAAGDAAASAPAKQPSAARAVKRRREERRVAELEIRVTKVEKEATVSREALDRAKAELAKAESRAVEARERARLALEAATAARRRVAALRRDSQGVETRLERANRELVAARAQLAATLE